MGILVILSKLTYNKNDIYNSMSISLLFTLISNPYQITNVGLQLSYLGLLGILLFNKNISNVISNIYKNKIIKQKYISILDKIKDILSVTISVQILLLPITLFHFNQFSPYTLFANLLISLIIGPIVLLGFLCILLSFVFFSLSKIFSLFVNFFLNILIGITNISNLPFAKIYVPTPKIYHIIIFYIIALFLNFLYTVYHSRKTNSTYIRIKNIIQLLKYKHNQNKLKRKRSNRFYYLQKYLAIFLIICIIFFSFQNKNLIIHFIDVGQGDSCFIITPKNNTILIDGGGSLSSSIDIGKDTLIPYLLDRGYSSLDYVIISHFDQDHVRGNFNAFTRTKSK